MMSDIDAATHERIVDYLQRSSVATLTNWLNGRGYRNVYMDGLHCLHPQMRLVGRARTMRLVPHRPDLSDLFLTRDANPHRKAVEEIGAGEVLVIDAHGNAEGGILGDIMTARLKARGAAGMVVDGSVRDLWQIATLDFPVYYRHVHAAAVQRALSAVEMDGVVTCGDCGVRPGDYIVGDPDGVVVVPAALAAECGLYASQHEQLEEFLRELVSGGRPLAEAYPPNDAVKAEYEQHRQAAAESAAGTAGDASVPPASARVGESGVPEGR